MKKIFLFIILLLISVCSFSQNQVLSSTMINHVPGYTLSLSIQNNTFTYSYSKPGVQTPTAFTLPTNDEIGFANGFKDLIKADMKTLKLILKVDPKKNQTDSLLIDSEANRLFYYFKGVEDLNDNIQYQPIAGTIDLNNQQLVPVYKILEDRRFLRSQARDSIREYKKLAKLNLANNLERKKLEHPEKNIDKNSPEYRERIKNLNKKLDRFQMTQPSKGLFEKRWFRYNGQKYGRHDFKVLMEDEIPKREDAHDKSYNKIFPEYEDSIQNLLKLKKSLMSASSAFNGKLNELFQFAFDTSRFNSRLNHLLKTPNAKRATSKLWNPNRIRSPFWNQYYFDNMEDVLFLLKSDSSDYRNEVDSLYRKNSKIKNEVDAKIGKLKISDFRVFLKSSEFDTLKTKFKTLFGKSKKWKNYKMDSIRIRKSIDSLSEKLKKTNDIIKSFRKRILQAISEESDSKPHVQAIRIKSIQVEITEGFIENILVIGEVGNKYKYINEALTLLKDTLVTDGEGDIKLENKHPFGFSRKVDYENLKYKYLYTIEKSSPGFRLYLQNLFTAKTYVEKLENYRRDYSPADTVITFDPTQQPLTHYELRKEPTYKLFQAKIFSDFVGLDKSSPNGLIQTEINKQVFLVTKRVPLGKREGANLGWLNYITPSVTISKLEQTNKDLLLNRIDSTGGKYAPVKYASTLDLKRHENFSTGFDLNLAILDIPNLKSTFLLDFGIRYGRVAIVDSTKANINGAIKKIGTNFGVNTFRIYPRFGWLIRTDERYSFYFEGGFNWYWLRDDGFKQVANDDVFRSTQYTGSHDTNRYINFLFEATLNTGAPTKTNKGKLFFRYQYNYQFNYFNTGFQQAQVGYSFYLLRK